jgi:hypothetical protein
MKSFVEVLMFARDGRNDENGKKTREWRLDTIATNEDQSKVIRLLQVLG